MGTRNLRNIILKDLEELITGTFSLMIQTQSNFNQLRLNEIIN